MDKQLLKALDNLSTALEKMAEILAKKSSGEKNSDVTKALQSGNFIEEIKEINIGVKEIKKDTQEILKQQKTIIELSKKKESDKKTESIESDPKKESSIKKGVATILLIAVAVLAIGMAFKLVGKVDFLSVVGLGIAIVLIGIAFEKIAKLKVTKTEALNASIVMVLMSAGVMLSSFFLSKMSTISITQALTGMLIGGMFLIIGPSLAGMIKSMLTSKTIKLPNGTSYKSEGLEWGTIIKSAVMLPLVMLGMSIGIYLSSKVLSAVSPISITQGLTSIFITAIFALASSSLTKMIAAFTKSPFGISFSDVLKAAISLPIVMLSLSVSIWWSSIVLGKVQPIGFAQALTAILITGIFVVASFGLGRILQAFKGISFGKAIAAAFLLPLVFPMFSVAIWLSSEILLKVKRLTFDSFIGSLMVAALFVVLSFGMGKIVKAIGKLKWSDVPKIPVFFTLMSIAIAISAFILYKAKEYFQIDYSIMLKILVLGAILGIISIIFGIATKIIGNISWGAVIKLPIFFTLMTLSIAISAFILYKAQKYIDGISFMTMLKILVFSVVLAIATVVLAIVAFIVNKLGSPVAYLKAGLSIVIIAATIWLSSVLISKGNYTNTPGLRWMFFSLLAIVLFGVVGWLLGKFGSPVTYIKAAIIIVVLAAAIFASSILLSKGKYKNYPSLKWLLFSALAIGAFGLVGFILSKFGGPTTFIKGAIVILVIAATILASSLILNLGKYKSYPPLQWALGVGASLVGFGLAAGILGLAVFGPQALIFAAGLVAILAVAGTILEVSKIISKGKYNLPGIGEWAKAVSLLFITFTPIIMMLGMMGIGGAIMKFFGAEDPFEKAKRMLIQIATTIVAVGGVLATGKYGKGPPPGWAGEVTKSISGFTSIFKSLDSKGGVAQIAMKSMMVFAIVQAMTGSAKLIHAAKAYWAAKIPENWAKSLSGNLLSFAKLTKDLEALLTTQEKITKIDRGIFSTTTTTSTIKQEKDMSIVVRAAANMASVARILFQNSKFFSAKIDPNYMKNVSSNILQFAILTKQIAAMQGGGLKGMLDKLTGRDPMSQMADGMVKIAKAYDILGASLKRFSASLSSIDGEKFSAIRKLTGNIAILASMDAEMFAKVMQVLEQRASVFSKLVDVDKKTRPSVGDKKGGESPEGVKSAVSGKVVKNKTESQLDEIISQLKQINYNTSGIDEWLASQGFASDKDIKIK